MASANSIDLVAKVSQALTEHVAPALAMDGASIEVLDVTDGVARIRMAEGSGCCPSSIMTMIMGIEQELRKLIPEVEYFEMVP